jgi:hypothetical protein
MDAAGTHASAPFSPQPVAPFTCANTKPLTIPPSMGSTFEADCSTCTVAPSPPSSVAPSRPRVTPSEYDQKISKRDRCALRESWHSSALGSIRPHSPDRSVAFRRHATILACASHPDHGAHGRPHARGRRLPSRPRHKCAPRTAFERPPFILPPSPRPCPGRVSRPYLSWPPSCHSVPPSSGHHAQNMALCQTLGAL